MDEIFLFLNLEGLDDGQVSHLRNLLHPSNLNSDIEFPWSEFSCEKVISKGSSSLNVHAPVFEVFITNQNKSLHTGQEPAPYCQSLPLNSSPVINNGFYLPITETVITPPVLPAFSNGLHSDVKVHTKCPAFVPPAKKPFNGDISSQSLSSFKLNPTVSCFVPKSTLPEKPEVYLQNGLTTDVDVEVADEVAEVLPEPVVDNDSTSPAAVIEAADVEPVQSPTVVQEISVAIEDSVSVGRRSWADIVSSGQKPATKQTVLKAPAENGKLVEKETETESLSVDEDKMALTLGKHLHGLHLDFESIFLQPRGLINRRNWCYINATLQALLACSPFYTLVRNLPLGPAVERGKSSTPVIDSMVRLTYEFQKLEACQEDLQLGQPFQPDFIYDMLRDLKSDCLKGQQEDAEEFLSFILNGMHEEMVKIIKNYEKKNNLNLNQVAQENGDISDGEDEWQVIGSKHKGMVTRKVAEHKTPVSDLLGGQIKSFLTTNGNKTSATIQPFFTLQLDIQSDNVTSVTDALKEMTVKEPIQGYTCAKTKQEVEAYSHLSLQKLPPILILHLKRFVYNKTGGCKKVMKKTDYPLQLELSKDIFSPDVKKIHRQKTYKLFGVMYHDGEEAVKGHYISDVYNDGCQTWIRCDDRTVSAVSEEQVLSYSPPRVPYLLFYHTS